MISEKTDFAMMVSSDLIAEVMGKYFNEEMFKRAVRIVDLKGADDGYVFNLAFEEKVIVKGGPTPVIEYELARNGIAQDVPLKRSHSKKVRG